MAASDSQAARYGQFNSNVAITLAMTLKTVSVRKQVPQQQEVKVEVQVHPFFTAALSTGNSQVHSPGNLPRGKGSWDPLDESQNRSGHTTGEDNKPYNTCSCRNSEAVWGEEI